MRRLLAEPGIVAVARSEAAATPTQESRRHAGHCSRGREPDGARAAERRPAHRPRTRPHPAQRQELGARRRAASGLTSRSIRILPTENVVQCMQCLLAFNPDQDIESQMSHLSSALGAVTIIELARANRTADLPKAQVSIASIVAIREGEIVAAGESPAEALSRAVSHSDAKNVELVTLYPCEDIEPAELSQLEVESDRSCPRRSARRCRWICHLGSQSSHWNNRWPSLPMSSTPPRPSRVVGHSRNPSVVPLRILWGGETYRDRVEISTADFYRRLRSESSLPTTSAPPPRRLRADLRGASRES